MNVLDTFAGIGGFALGMEAVGCKAVAFCEIDPYATKVLNKNWPEVPVYDDIQTLTAKRLATDGIRVDCITGGFPCQDASKAGAMWGKRQGTDGDRTGLWSELSRLIGEVRPKYAILENVPNLLAGDSGRWFARILRDLAEIGFDAEWHCISASSVGAPHRRERLWIIAYPNFAGLERGGEAGNFSEERQERGDQLITRCSGISGGSWATEPSVCRVVNGLPNRSHRLRCLGNAVVPQIPQLIVSQLINLEGRV